MRKEVSDLITRKENENDVPIPREGPCCKKNGRRSEIRKIQPPTVRRAK